MASVLGLGAHGLGLGVQDLGCWAWDLEHRSLGSFLN